MNDDKLQELKNEIKSRLPILAGISKFTDIKLTKDNKFCCLWHDDHSPSAQVHVNQDNGYCYPCNKYFDVIEIVGEVRGLDFVKTINFLAQELNINTEPVNKIPNKNQGFNWKGAKKIREHFYQDELGNEIIRKEIWKDTNGNKTALVYNIAGVDRNTRNNDKTSGNSGLRGLKYPVYQLPAVIQAIANNKTIYLVEGEKDAHSLFDRGISCATVGGATSKWTPEHLAIFPKGHEVVILVDNDDSGKKYGTDTANAFRKHGCNVKLINLADHEPRMGNKADVTDWLELGHAADQLIDFVGKTEYWELARDKAGDTPKTYDDWRDNYKKLSDYEISKNGQLCRIVTKKIEGVEAKTLVPLSNFMARISKDVIKDDGQEQKLMFEIEGFLSNGKVLPTITIESNKFTAMNWIIDNWGSSPILSPGGSCRDYLRHSIQKVSEYDKDYRTIFNYTGWRKINNKWCYLHAGGAIGADGVTVDLASEGNLSKYQLPTIGNEIESARMALKLLYVADFKITIPLLALSYLSPLTEPLRQAGHEPDFVMWIQGMTQSMKSSLSAVVLNHFGKGFTKNNMPASFKDTYVNIDRKGFLLKDNLLVADDFYPSTSKAEAQKMHTMAQKMLRAWGDRIARGRGNVDGTLRQTYAPRGMCLVTGEDLPQVGQSGMARYFLIKIKRGDIDKTKLTELQNNTDLLAQNMANYINWLSPQIDNIAKVAGSGLGQLRDTLTQCHNLDGRMPETLAFLLIGLDMFLKYVVSIKAITENQQLEIFNKAQNDLADLACSHADNIKEEQPVSQFLRAINVMLATNQVEIINIGDMPREGTPVIGYREVGAECYYLIPDATYAALVQFCNKQDGKFPVGKPTLWQHLANDGHLECGKVNGKETPTKVKKVHGKNTRCIHLKISSLEVDSDEE